MKKIDPQKQICAGEYQQPLMTFKELQEPQEKACGNYRGLVFWALEFPIRNRPACTRYFLKKIAS